MSAYIKTSMSIIESKIGFDYHNISFLFCYQKDESLLVVDISELDDDVYEDTDEDEESWDQDRCFILYVSSNVIQFDAAWGLLQIGTINAGSSSMLSILLFVL